MAVKDGDRGERKMAVLTKTNELAIYTIKICSNPKVFLPQYQTALTNDIIQTAKNIYIYARDANSIRVKNSDGKVIAERRDERKHLQDKAIRECNNLLDLMQMAQPLYHLKTKRIKYWGGLTVEAKGLLKSWKESDAKRYN